MAVQNAYMSTDALARLVLFVARAQAEPLVVAHANAGGSGSRPMVRARAPWGSRVHARVGPWMCDANCMYGGAGGAVCVWMRGSRR